MEHHQLNMQQICVENILLRLFEIQIFYLIAIWVEIMCRYVE